MSFSVSLCVCGFYLARHSWLPCLSLLITHFVPLPCFFLFLHQLLFPPSHLLSPALSFLSSVYLKLILLFISILSFLSPSLSFSISSIPPPPPLYPFSATSSFLSPCISYLLLPCLSYFLPPPFSFSPGTFICVCVCGCLSVCFP